MVLYDNFNMRSVILLDIIITVAVTFCALKCNVCAITLDQDGGHQQHGLPEIRTQYTRESILLLQPRGYLFKPHTDSFPPDIVPNVDSGKPVRPRRKRPGHRGGVRRRLRRDKSRLPLPSIIMANTRSLRPKHPNYNFHELCANVFHRQEYRDASLLCFCETWFCNKITDDSLFIDGFGSPYRCDRDLSASGKLTASGGVCIYVNDNYCHRGNITVRKTLSTPYVDLISISLRPKYLPREFGQVFVTVVYTHPTTNDGRDRAATEIADVVHSLETLAPDAPNFILGDFNTCDLKTKMPKMKQYVKCKTLNNGTPDRCYGNVSNAFKCVPLPEIGKSDHCAVHLIPSYLPVAKTNPVVRKCVKVFSSEKVDELRACYECTDWDMFIDSSSSVDEATDVISSYIMFCEDSIIPCKQIKIFPNSKPWISGSLKHAINEKNRIFKAGDKVEGKRAQKELRDQIRDSYLGYRKKIEKKFEEGNMRDAYKGLKLLTGQDKPKQTINLDDEEKIEYANKLNEFYCRFERSDLKNELDSVIADLEGRDRMVDVDDLEIHSSKVAAIFKRQKLHKAVGPDRIGGRLLKNCADQLAYVFSLLFSWSLRDCVVPSLWKSSIISPVPKSRAPKELNDFRPVALTSIVMKCFERLVLRTIQTQTKHALDPLQFAYKANRSTDDATLTLLHNAYTHLDAPGSFVRILFIDFSSAFNTIQPHLMALKLLNLSVCPKLILWIISFLVNRSQSVSFHHAISDSRSTSTGSPQGTLLSPVLFTLYTNDISGSVLTPIIKYSDDTAIQDLSNSHSPFSEQVFIHNLVQRQFSRS